MCNYHFVHHTTYVRKLHLFHVDSCRFYGNACRWSLALLTSFMRDHPALEFRLFCKRFLIWNKSARTIILVLTESILLFHNCSKSRETSDAKGIVSSNR